MSNEEFAELMKKIMKENICSAIDMALEIANKSKAGVKQITVDKATVDKARAFFEFEGFEEEVIE